MFAGVLLTSPALLKAQGTATETKLKSAYIYGFGRYVQWPATSPQSSFVIAIVGDSSIASMLRKVAGQRKLPNSSGKQVPIEVQQFESTEDFEACHILFLSSGLGKEKVDSFLKVAKDRPVLIVSDSSKGDGNFMVEFVNIDGRVKFNIRLNDINAQQLKIDAKLLTAANEIVK